jgi:hypothetical protein
LKINTISHTTITHDGFRFEKQTGSNTVQNSARGSNEEKNHEKYERRDWPASRATRARLAKTRPNFIGLTIRG